MYYLPLCHPLCTVYNSIYSVLLNLKIFLNMPLLCVCRTKHVEAPRSTYCTSTINLIGSSFSCDGILRITIHARTSKIYTWPYLVVFGLVSVLLNNLNMNQFYMHLLYFLRTVIQRNALSSYRIDKVMNLTNRELWRRIRERVIFAVIAIVQPKNDKALDKELCSMLSEKKPNLIDIVKCKAACLRCFYYMLSEGQLVVED